jgi:hypothetical protein
MRFSHACHALFAVVQQLNIPTMQEANDFIAVVIRI